MLLGVLDADRGLVQPEDPAAGPAERAAVAAVAAAVLERPGTVGRTIEFNNGDVPIDEALDALR